MRKAKFSLLLLPLFIPLTASADTALVVSKTDGGTETFLLSQEPEITFDETDCTFTSTDYSVSVPRSEIVDFHFTEMGTTAISTPSKAGGVSVRRTADGLSIQGVAAESVRVYNLGGASVGATVSQSGDGINVSLSALPASAYIVKYGNNSIKISKK